jgi:hypothetical protein
VSRALKTLAIVVAFVAIYTLSRHATSPTTTTTSTSVVSSTTSSSQPSETTCRGSDLRGVFNQGQGAAGTIYASVTLTKTSSGQCALKGWPLLTLQDRTGQVLPSSTVQLPTVNSQIQFPDSRANAAPSLVTLRKGSTTTFSLAYSDVPTGNETTCGAATTISVGLVRGASTVPVTPDYPQAPCNHGQVWVSPFY